MRQSMGVVFHRVFVTGNKEEFSEVTQNDGFIEDWKVSTETVLPSS